MNQFRDFFRKVSKNNTRTCWVLKCDIRKFFASIDHIILKDILAKHISDKDILLLLNQVIDSFHTPLNSHTVLSNKNAIALLLLNRGLPLGNLTSQLLVNIYMNEFDQYMKHVLKVKYYVRYADDFVILSDNREELEEVKTKVSIILSEKLRLELHPDKVFIKTFSSGVDFLGWIHFPYHRVLRTATKRRMVKNLEQNTKEEIRRSYMGLLKHGDGYKLRKLV